LGDAAEQAGDQCEQDGGGGPEAAGHAGRFGRTAPDEQGNVGRSTVAVLIKADRGGVPGDLHAPGAETPGPATSKEL
jgi:hypothetical protein